MTAPPSLPASLIASRALTHRFTSTCSNWPRSARTGHKSRPWLMSSETFSPIKPRQQHSQIGQHIRHGQGLRTQGLLARERQQLPYQRGGTVGVLLDVHNVLKGRVGRAVVGEQQVGKTDNRRQHIVEIVRDTACKLADGLHLLALRHLPLERLLLGHFNGVEDGALMPLALRSLHTVTDGGYEEAHRAVLIRNLAGDAGQDGIHIGNFRPPLIGACHRRRHGRTRHRGRRDARY